jgi:hypothetical protein
VALLLQSALAWLVLLVVSAIVVEMVFPLLAPRLRRAAMEGRLPILVAFCWLPAGAASALLLGCYAPWALAALGFGHDHCGVHGGHLHLCVRHVHGVGLAHLGWVLLMAVGGWLVVSGRELAADLWRGRGLIQSLHACADVDDDGVVVVDADLPWSVTAGLLRPRVVVTSALIETFSLRQREAVLAHERCHVKERHAVIKLLASVGAMMFRPSTRLALLGDVTLACERRCDEHAAAAIGDRLDVAATLLAARRALFDRLPLGVFALQGTAAGLELRVRGLTDRSGVVPASVGRVVGLAAGFAVVALITGHELHHEVETLLSYLVH